MPHLQLFLKGLTFIKVTGVNTIQKGLLLL